jgi:hypothetical protein
MGHQEPASLFIITHQTQMKDIQGSGGSWCGFMTTNAMTFGPDLLMSTKFSASSQLMSKNYGMAWHPWATRSQYHFSLQDHSSDPYGGYSMVWRQLVWFHENNNNAMTLTLFPDLLMLISGDHDDYINFKEFPSETVTQSA